MFMFCEQNAGQFRNVKVSNVGRDSVVGITTRNGLDGPGIESADPSGRAV